MDLIHTSLKWLSHNRYTGLGAAAFITLVTYGCIQPTVHSPYSSKDVTAGELSNEFNASLDKIEDTYNANLSAIDAKIAENKALLAKADRQKTDTDALFAQLKRAQDDRLALVNTIQGIAAPLLGPTVGPIVTQLLPFGIGALGLGTLADNRRKNRIILDLKSSTGGPASSAPTSNA